MQLAPPPILDPSASSFISCTLSSISCTMSDLISHSMNKKQLCAMCLFPSHICFRHFNNFQSAQCHFRMKVMKRRARKLMLIKEQNAELALLVSNVADHAKTLFKNMSLVRVICHILARTNCNHNIFVLQILLWWQYTSLQGYTIPPEMGIRWSSIMDPTQPPSCLFHVMFNFHCLPLPLM